MKYEKPALNTEQLASLLIERGLVGDLNQISQCLQSVGYYRLSGYTYPFRIIGCDGSRGDQFRQGVSFQSIWNRYVFDRRLRLLVMDAIECVEVSLRSLIATAHSLEYGLFAYAVQRESLPDLDSHKWSRFKNTVISEQDRSREQFKSHFFEKYGDVEEFLPLWMAVEVWSFGTLFTFYRGCSKSIRTDVARHFQVHEKVMESWILCLNTVRNICAHHGRLWNRVIGTSPKLPRKLSEWRDPVLIQGNRVFVVLSILSWLVSKSSDSTEWQLKVIELLNHAENEIPLSEMGFPENWRESPIWL